MKIAVLGTGNMGRAIIGGLFRKFEDNITVSAFDLLRTAMNDLGGNVKVNEPEHWADQDAIIVSVKPADLPAAAEMLKGHYKNHQNSPLLISVAAGITTENIRNQIGQTARVCRVMPNTPALIGEGMSACCFTENCSEKDRDLAVEIFSACGKVTVLAECYMDAATGLSGSGPAYVYAFIEALAEGGVTAGLPFSVALESAVQTVIGAAKMVEQENEHPSVLKSRVMSPGGTTANGALALEKGKFKHSVMSAVLQAAKRARELSGLE
ncbi:Pyrroline-5-carboxylate reductase [Chitinispirillum alkaliphilum]|nr:Pyrroline-5-carboxylate reductase [Chitinispirillum alkaliphilum]